MDDTIDTPVGSVELKWREVIPVGAGLENMDGTCYVNAVLQCLTYTPPLTNYLLYGEHSRTCQGCAVCMMCAMEEHVKQVFSNPGGVVHPDTMLNLIGDQFKLGLQHGAYKYLKFTLKAMHQSYLNGCRLNGQSVSTSPVQQIFEGCLQVTTICGDCGRVSQNRKLYRALTLEIKDVDSVPQALTRHFQAQLVCAKFGYRCRKSCNRESIQDLPTALVIRLNRANVHEKITKFVSYPETLDMSLFMSQSSGAPEIYNLYAVLVHSGSSINTGHFYSHVKASDGEWYRMNDKSVSKGRRSLKQQAYMLFYIRSPNPADVRNRPEPTSSNTEAASISSAFNNLKLIPKVLRSVMRLTKDHHQRQPCSIRGCNAAECEADEPLENQSAEGKTGTRTERTDQQVRSFSPLKKPTGLKRKRDELQESSSTQKRAQTAYVQENSSGQDRA